MEYVHTENFTDLDHIYTQVGPNALGYLKKGTRNMLPLGHFIATHLIEDEEGNNLRKVTIYDPKTNTFMPQAFNLKAWKTNFKAGAFGPRYRRASMVTFMRFQADIEVTKESSFATHSAALQNVSRIQYVCDNEDQRRDRPHGTQAGGVRYIPHGYGSFNNDEPREPGDMGTGAGGPPDDPSSSSSSEHSSDSETDEYPDSNGDYDEDRGGYSSDEGDSSDGSGGYTSSYGDDDTISTMPSDWGTEKYKAPRDHDSLLRRVKDYDRKVREKKKRRKKKGGSYGGKSKGGSKGKKKRKSKSSSKYMKKRGVIQIKPWNGSNVGTSFKDTMNEIRNFVRMQPSMDYIVAETFLRAYNQGSHKEYLHKHRVSPRQYNTDVKLFHAYLCSEQLDISVELSW